MRRNAAVGFVVLLIALIAAVAVPAAAAAAVWRDGVAGQPFSVRVSTTASR